MTPLPPSRPRVRGCVILGCLPIPIGCAMTVAACALASAAGSRALLAWRRRRPPSNQG